MFLERNETGFITLMNNVHCMEMTYDKFCKKWLLYQALVEETNQKRIYWTVSKYKITEH